MCRDLAGRLRVSRNSVTYIASFKPEKLDGVLAQNHAFVVIGYLGVIDARPLEQ